MIANFDHDELNKFSQLADKWWDKEGEFKPLHDINPLRLDFIEQYCLLKNQCVIDIGCGGGILAEGMALRGAHVTGIDLSVATLKAAQSHCDQKRLNINYQCISAEEKALAYPDSYDVVTCLEMLEHVPDPSSIIQACATLCKKAGWIFFSTINRNLTAYLQAVIGAEYILKLLPIGTHDYARFLKPSELIHYLRQAQLEAICLKGIGYRLLTRSYYLKHDTTVNYLLAAKKLV